MAKKDFSKLSTSEHQTRTYGDIAKSASRRGQQAEVGEEEKAERLSNLKTQGRKGCKATRINMAFSPENHAFIKLLAKASGRTMTELANDIITAFRHEHPDFEEKANSYLAFINSGLFSAKLGDPNKEE